MMNQSRKGAGRLLAVLLLLCALTGCHTAADGFGTAADKGKNTQVAEGITEEQPQFFDVQKAQFRKMGETISGIDVQHGTVIEEALRYTFTKAALFESFAEAGLEEAKQNLAEAAPFLTEDGELKPGVRLLLVDVTVQNVRAESLRNITELNILSGVSVSAEKGKASFFELYPSGPVWFSNPMGKRGADGWKEYYYYKLAAGQSKELKVAWIIDTSSYDTEHLYLTFDADEERKFIKITV